MRRGLLALVASQATEAREQLIEHLPQVGCAADYSKRILGWGVYAEVLKLRGEFRPCRTSCERMLVLAEQVGDPLWLVSVAAQLGGWR